MNAWFGDPRALAGAVRPVIDTAASRSLARLIGLLDDPTAALPAVLVLALSFPVALLIGVPTGGVGIGFGLGLLVAAGVALNARARARRDAAALAGQIPSAQLVIVPGRDHMGTVPARQFKEAALEFLAQN